MKNSVLLSLLLSIVVLIVLDCVLGYFKKPKVESFEEPLEEQTIEDYDEFKKIMRLYSLVLDRLPTKKELYDVKREMDEGKLTEQELELKLRDTDEFKKKNPVHNESKYRDVRFDLEEVLTDEEESKFLENYRSVLKKDPRPSHMPFLQQKFIDLEQDPKKFVKYLTKTLEYKIAVAQGEIEPQEVHRNIFIQEEERPITTDEEKKAKEFNEFYNKNKILDKSGVAGNVEEDIVGVSIDKTQNMGVGSILPFEMIDVDALF